MQWNGKSSMFTAKEIGKTEKGSTYVIGQDTPSSFHISVSIGDYVLYDFLNGPDSIEAIHQHIRQLETELEEKQINIV